MREIHKLLRPQAKVARGAEPQAPPDGYGEQILKLIPAESVALFVFLDGVIAAASAEPHPQASPAVGGSLFAAVVLAGIIGTPLYLRRGLEVASVGQLVISTIAFVVWAFATGKTPSVLWPDRVPPPLVGSVLLPLFAFAAPLLLPKGAPPPLTEPAEPPLGTPP